MLMSSSLQGVCPWERRYSNFSNLTNFRPRPPAESLSCSTNCTFAQEVKQDWADFFAAATGGVSLCGVRPQREPNVKAELTIYRLSSALTASRHS